MRSCGPCSSFRNRLSVNKKTSRPRTVPVIATAFVCALATSGITSTTAGWEVGVGLAIGKTGVDSASEASPQTDEFRLREVVRS